MKKLLLIIMSVCALQTMRAANWFTNELTPDDKMALAALRERPNTPGGFWGCHPYGVKHTNPKAALILAARSASSCGMDEHGMQVNARKEPTSPPPIK